MRMLVMGIGKMRMRVRQGNVLMAMRMGGAGNNLHRIVFMVMMIVANSVRVFMRVS